MLVVVCGLQGTGKSTVARKIALKTGGQILRTDVIRKEMFERPTYSEEEISNVYAEMFRRAKNALSKGTVILDATFKSHKDREDARIIAASLGLPFSLVRTICDEAVLKERITARKDDASDARFEHYLATKAAFEPLLHEHVSIDTTHGEDAIEKQIAGFL